MKRTYIFIVIVFGTMLALSTLPLSAQVSGSGTPDRIPLWTAPTTLGDSWIVQDIGRVIVERTLRVEPQGPGNGVEGFSNGPARGVQGISVLGIGVYGSSVSDFGVQGDSDSNYGVLGISQSSMGVRGETQGFSTGVGGVSITGNGIGGVSPGTAGVFGAGTRAGIFAGDVGIDGDLLVSGGKFFRIDHPLDPANKYLVHASVESPEAMNLYNGNITTDLSGNATVELPSYFTTLNRDFRYQLTVIGQFAQAIVASEIADNRFTIKTDRPQVKVSWQVTGIRQDAWAQAHPMQVEQPKPERERGTYLHPELFNQPEEKSWAWALSPELMQELKALRAKKNQLKAENSGGQH